MPRKFDNVEDFIDWLYQRIEISLAIAKDKTQPHEFRILAISDIAVSSEKIEQLQQFEWREELSKFDDNPDEAIVRYMKLVTERGLDNRFEAGDIEVALEQAKDQQALSNFINKVIGRR